MPDQHAEYDDLIIRLLANDDPHAIDLLHTLYYKRLFHSIHSMTHDEADAADILNDLLAAIWEKRETLVLKKPLLPYLYRAARNRTINFMRGKSRLKEISMSPERLRNSMEESGTGADSGLNIEDVHALWRMAQQKMTYRVCQTFVLSEHEDKTNAEIAAAMGLSVSAVEKNLARAWKVIEEVKRSYLKLLVIAGPLTLYLWKI